MTDQAEQGSRMASPPTDRFKALKLSLLFGVIYFVQGIGEPTTGLIAQPVRSLLKGWGLDANEIAGVMLIVGFPWYIKPLFGLLTDFVPIFGSRRKSYLLLSTMVASVGLIVAGLIELPPGSVGILTALLLLPCIGVAFTDVVADALMVEEGQPLKITGRLQSVQWGALYAAGILTGVIGGFLAEQKLQQLGFVICGGMTLITFVMSIFVVKERRRASVDMASIKSTLKSSWAVVRSKEVLSVTAFLFLLNFNPFSADVLYVHMTEAMKLSEQFVGTTYSVAAVASIVACVIYGIVGPKLPLRLLIHGSLVCMVASSLCYWGLAGETSAMIIAALVGFFYMLTSLVQLDLAARFVPAETAGTVFALLMSLSNLSVSLSSNLGGYWYESWKPEWGEATTFQVLVGVGALFTAACWLLLPLLPKHDRATVSA